MDAAPSNPCRTFPLSAKGLKKRLGTTLALGGVDLAVEPGEIVALLGPNGAGKTTLLHVLAGLLRPDEGSVHVAGAIDPTRASVRKHLGFAPQPTAVYEDLTVEENLTFFARIHGVPRREIEGAVARGLAFAQLESRASARAGTLSGGMRRRLHVASAIVHQPAVLLLDEPTVGIDSASCDHLLQAIGALRDKGTAVVWSTHDDRPIEVLSARPFHLERGRVVS
jgi:ABC-2 type transport system ATP-binding protein